MRRVLAVLSGARIGYAQEAAAPESEPQTIRETVTVSAPAPPEVPERAALTHAIEQRTDTGRATDSEPSVLLRRLSCPTPDDCAHDDLDCADAPAAPAIRGWCN